MHFIDAFVVIFDDAPRYHHFLLSSASSFSHERDPEVRDDGRKSLTVIEKSRWENFRTISMDPTITKKEGGVTKESVVLTEATAVGEKILLCLPIENVLCFLTAYSQRPRLVSTSKTRLGNYYADAPSICNLTKQPATILDITFPFSISIRVTIKETFMIDRARKAIRNDNDKLIVM